MKKILLLSNGHGEDLVAAKLIQALAGSFACSVLPLVGEGKVFDALKVEVLGSRKKFPGGGFSLRNISHLLKDLFSGYLANLFLQYRTLRSLKRKFDLVIAIGDLVPLLAAIKIKAPIIFVGVNKSEYYRWSGYKYTFLEKFLMRKYCQKVYARDELTAKNLKENGINAEYVGNPLMDASPQPFGLSPLHFVERGAGVRLGFLPGTRDGDVQLNLEDFANIQAEILKRLPNASFITATSPQLFGDLLATSAIVIGLSGTGNEQAAGCGLPVVSFPGRGPQYDKKFAAAQSQLLGSALCVVKRDPAKVAQEVLDILNNKERYQAMSREGQKRMGKPGAIKKIILDINTSL